MNPVKTPKDAWQDSEKEPAIDHVGTGKKEEPNIQAEGRATQAKDPLRMDQPTIESEFGQSITHRGPPGGDFGGDLAPGGVSAFPGSDGLHPGFEGGGNLMGPNHPAFSGDGAYTPFQGSDSGPDIGGLGMRPRFDPYGPPGGPTDPSRNPNFPGRGRGPPRGGTGEPNPDHQRPPSDFTAGPGGTNMFM
jgi:hypothetical protein